MASVSVFGGRSPPLPQCTFRSPLVNRVPGKRYSTRSLFVQLCALGTRVCERTLRGAVSSSPRYMALKIWQPISPSVPVPKPWRRRQFWDDEHRELSSSITDVFAPTPSHPFQSSSCRRGIAIPMIRPAVSISPWRAFAAEPAQCLRYPANYLSLDQIYRSAIMDTRASPRVAHLHNFLISFS